MSTATPSFLNVRTLAELLQSLGGVPADRVLTQPFPGTAGEADFLRANEELGIRCELVDGTLVEKAMGSYESLLAAAIITLLSNFVWPRKLGTVLGADSMFRLFDGNIRMPDVAFIPKERYPNGLPKGPVWALAPALAVEVLSVSNTVSEIARKRKEFFANGVLLVWVVDPIPRTVTIYTDGGIPVVKGQTEILDGGAVLPGFSLLLSELFARMDG